MNCLEHEGLEQILIDRREQTRKAAIGTEEFQKLDILEVQAIHNLKDHDAEHGCQRAA